MSLREAFEKFRKREWVEFRKNMRAGIYLIGSYLVAQAYYSTQEAISTLGKKLKQIDTNAADIAQIKKWHEQDSAYKVSQTLLYSDIQKKNYDQDLIINKTTNRVDANENNLDFVMGIKRK